MATIHPYAWHNGRLVSTGDIRFSPFQTGLLTGWGLFSTLRIYRGVPFALEDHWERLHADGVSLRIALDGLWSEIQRGFSETIAKNNAQEAVARVYLIRNRGGLLDMPQERATDLLIVTRELRQWAPAAKLRLQEHGRHAAAPLSGTKTLTWAHNLVMVEEANAAGYDDVLLLNERGELAECTAANIFLVRNGVLSTPPLNSGALPGVSRKVLMQHGPRHGLRIEERTLFPDDLFGADEVFITSSTREVQPVSKVGDRVISTGTVTGRVAELFHHAVREYLAEHAKGA